MPLVGLSGLVFEDESENGVALLDSVLAIGLAGVKGLVDLLEGGGRRELVCRKVRC